MKNWTAGEILEAAKQRVTGYVSDTLPLTVAVADPTKQNIIIGLSIQKDYPLTQIERSYGIPFGHLRQDP